MEPDGSDIPPLHKSTVFSTLSTRGLIASSENSFLNKFYSLHSMVSFSGPNLVSMSQAYH
ncbi:hypothetical protein ACTXT7_016327 [Hymenolepis weldensis]